MILPITYNLLAGGQALDTTLQQLVQNIFNETVEGALSMKEVLRVLLSVAAGKTDISGSTVTFRDTTDSTNRVVASMTGSERSTVTLDAS